MPRVLAPLAGLLAVFLAAPFFAGLGQMGLADWQGTDGPALLRASLISVTSALLATGLVAVCGIPLGYVLARRRSRGMALLGFLVQLPLALPPLASGVLLLLRLIGGLDPADHAFLTLGGANLARLPTHRRAIAYVPQTCGLLPYLTVAEQIRFGVGCDPDRARHWTARLGLSALEHRRSAELSLGQQQRIALARALSRPADLLLLDEPFSALDITLRTRLRQEMLILQAEIDRTTVLVTHDPAEAMLLADEILLLEEGRVLQSGPAETVFARPANEAAARLLGADTVAAGNAVAPGLIDVGGLCIAVAGLPVLPGPVGWAVHPHGVRVGDQGYAATILDAGVVRAGQRLLDVGIGNARVQAMADPGQPVAPGACRVSIDPAAVQVWPA